jgi:hypothetical protein
MTVRWRFETLDSSQVYAFPINPNGLTSAIANRDITWDYSSVPGGGGYAGKRAPRAPVPFEFSGVLRSVGQYDALVLWVNKNTWVRLVDHLERTLVVRLLLIDLEQQGKSRNIHAPYRHTYTMKAITKP